MTLDRYRHASLSIDDLCEAATELLGSAAPDDARVQALPDTRIVRYYQSIGVVDRPSRYDGRNAVYGLRHLLQVVAVKRLQAHGLSLAQIQRVLQGRTDAELEAALADRASPAAAPPPPLPMRPDSVATAAAATARTGWVASEAAPGVVVSIDGSRVPDAAAVLARIREFLSQGGRP